MAKQRRISISKLLSLLILFCALFTVSYTLNPVPCPLAYAAIPHLINYQGRLTDKENKPLEGAYALTFRIYDAETGSGTMTPWKETYSEVVIQKGIFSVLLGSVTSLNIPFDKPYFLEIVVGDEKMSPRQRITSAGYAIKAEEAEKLGGKQPSDYALAADISPSPTANKAVKLDANAKLPLSALKFYDSGWFAVTTNTSYTKYHNLGTTKVIYQLWFSPNSNGEPCYSIYGIVELDQDARGNFRGGFVTSLTPANITISTSGMSGNGNNVFDGLTSHNSAASYTSGYYRVIILALE